MEKLRSFSPYESLKKITNNISLSETFSNTKWVYGFILGSIVVVLIFVIIHTYIDDPDNNWLAAAAYINIILLSICIIFFAYRA